jgi:hypothetical protein
MFGRTAHDASRASLYVSWYVAVATLLLCLLAGTFAGAAQAQTVTYKGAVNLPPPLNGEYIQLMNDSGLGATDLDVPNDPDDPGSIYTKSRNLVTLSYVYTMYNDANGKPYFQFTSRRANLRRLSINERHNNISPTIGRPDIPVLTGNAGADIYRLLAPTGDNLLTLFYILPSEDYAISHGGIYGGNTTTIFAAQNQGGGYLRLYSLDIQTRIVTMLSGSQDANLPIPTLVAQTFGTDGNLYVLDTTGKRIMSLDLGLNGGTRGTLLNIFSLDPEKPADNSLTMDFAGNQHVQQGGAVENGLFGHVHARPQRNQSSSQTDPLVHEFLRQRLERRQRHA